MRIAADDSVSALWCGSYTADSDGHGSGIALIRTADDGTLGPAHPAAITDSPSFIAEHPTLPVVYAVGEAAEQISAFTITIASGEDGEDGETGAILEPLGRPWPAGAAVCHVTVDPAGRYLIAACWGDGRVLAYDLDEAGRILARHEAEAATDPHTPDPYTTDPTTTDPTTTDSTTGDSTTTDSTTGDPTTTDSTTGDPTTTGDPRCSRAHTSLVLPDGRVLTTDLGFDLVRIWRYRAGHGLVAEQSVTLPLGSGPRHAALHPNGQVYILTEYSVEVVVLQPDVAGRYRVAQVTPAIPGAATTNASGVAVTGAHISIDATAAHVHVTVRGANRVAVLEVCDDGARLEPIADVDCGGDWPRHHLQRGTLLHVANQLSDTIATFRLDSNAVPAELLQTLSVGSPTCIISRR